MGLKYDASNRAIIQISSLISTFITSGNLSVIGNIPNRQNNAHNAQCTTKRLYIDVRVMDFYWPSSPIDFCNWMMTHSSKLSGPNLDWARGLVTQCTIWSYIGVLQPNGAVLIVGIFQQYNSSLSEQSSPSLILGPLYAKFLPGILATNAITRWLPSYRNFSSTFSG